MERSQVQNLISERRWEEALFKLQAIAARAPSADVYLIIGQCHEELKQTISAVQAYTKAAELAPQSPISHYRLGALLLDQREYKLASDEIQRAIALDPWGARIDLAMARKKMQEITNKNGR
jgi:tetratricopeptide (TPR) repeat protein